jgi:hypothetical protein
MADPMAGAAALQVSGGALMHRHSDKGVHSSTGSSQDQWWSGRFFLAVSILN